MSTSVSNPIEDARAAMMNKFIPLPSLSDCPSQCELMKAIILLEEQIEPWSDTIVHLFAIGQDKSDACTKAELVYGELWDKNQELKDKLAHMLTMRHYERED